MRKPIEKIKLTPELKLHYDTLHKWMRLHPEIQHKKLQPFGFQISVNTVPDELVDEFIEISTFKPK
jgi:hypothetical protein